METKNTRLCVLLIDADEPLFTHLLNETTSFSQDKRLPQLAIHRCHTLQSALQHLPQHHYDLVILNSTLPDSQGEATLRHWRQLAPTVPLVLVIPEGETHLLYLAKTLDMVEILYHEKLTLL